MNAWKPLIPTLICAMANSVAVADELTDAARQSVDCLALEVQQERLECLEANADVLRSILTLMDQDKSEPEWARAPAREDPVTQGAEETVPIWARVLGGGSYDDQANEIEIVVTRILKNNVGRHYFVTEDGMEWRQTIAGYVEPPKSLPVKAKITRSLTGNPTLRFEDGTDGAYKVRREK